MKLLTSARGVTLALFWPKSGRPRFKGMKLFLTLKGLRIFWCHLQEIKSLWRTAAAVSREQVTVGQNCIIWRRERLPLIVTKNKQTQKGQKIYSPDLVGLFYQSKTRQHKVRKTRWCFAQSCFSDSLKEPGSEIMKNLMSNPRLIHQPTRVWPTSPLCISLWINSWENRFNVSKGECTGPGL